ncbi:phosphopantetheinyl transferase (holo-ACP synthase) [Actinoalloteichus hoggarensis]|uniref:4'-phosphopantetheinyl transferase n=1 Tax=Actinoalloteichus hoggarensis TaxID=1470176 RepID=A0A221VYX8_9PSEU|nr:hypothetical protein [Actinoalloteichus hoggarensis]ASO18755.1 4'-phosphopantetheinyl transferase [Actinoalloteichus hoggarensis]MBB5919988.1 phosphopantetheinyl transferase (holo-ACP synthase) [Actinoalloteichus hoggarensis]
MNRTGSAVVRFAGLSRPQQLLAGLPLGGPGGFAGGGEGGEPVWAAGSASDHPASDDLPSHGPASADPTGGRQAPSGSDPVDPAACARTLPGTAATQPGTADRTETAGAPASIEQVFTRAERLRSGTGRTVEHWAGRLAAKLAVLRLLAVPASAERLGQVEVLPRRTPMCEASTACLHGHPPGVRLTGDLVRRAARRGGEQIRISISHTRDTALSVAIASASLPEDQHCEAA